jgi:dipeptidyl aminopeptidase/acylaminoacyl peptidase
MRRLPRSLLVVAFVGASGCAAQTPPPGLAPDTPASPAAQPAATAATPPSATSIEVAPDPMRPGDPERDAALDELARAVVDAHTSGEPAWSRDGKKVVFTSDRDGLPQLYVSDLGTPNAPTTRLVAMTERAFSAVALPDGKSMLFGSDRGADENFSIFRVDLDGKNLVELTPQNKLHRDQPFVADGKPDTVFYSARAAADVGTVVYAASASAPGDEKVLYKDDKPGFLVDVSKDAKWGLYRRYLTRSENYLIVLELSTGVTRPLYPTSGKVSIWAAQLSADGKRVYISTDGGGEEALLLALDTATGKELARYVERRPATATIPAIAVAKKGQLVALSVNAGNHGEVRLLDAMTLKPKATVSVPLGDGRIGSFSEDGKRLGLEWSTPAQPNDVYAIDTRTGKVTPIHKEARPELDRLPAMEASIVNIDAFDGGKIPANVYLPAGAQGKKLPVIVHYHGGPAASSTVGWSAWARFFTSLGYAWVEPNVRGSNGFGRAFEEADNGPKRLDAFKDIESSGRWVAAQPWADKDRLVVLGGSYGGYTVLIGLTRFPDLWRAGVDMVGVANLRTMLATTTGIIREVFVLEFGDVQKDGAFLDSISPLRDADKIVDPLFVYQGQQDPRVPRAESDQIVKALRARRVPVEYMVAADEGHSLDRRENQLEFYVRVARFLDVALK